MRVSKTNIDLAIRLSGLLPVSVLKSEFNVKGPAGKICAQIAAENDFSELITDDNFGQLRRWNPIMMSEKQRPARQQTVELYCFVP